MQTRQQQRVNGEAKLLLCLTHHSGWFTPTASLASMGNTSISLFTKTKLVVVAPRTSSSREGHFVSRRAGQHSRRACTAFGDESPPPQAALTDGLVHDSQRNAIFDAAARVQELRFAQDLHAARRPKQVSRATYWYLPGRHMQASNSAPSTSILSVAHTLVSIAPHRLSHASNK